MKQIGIFVQAQFVCDLSLFVQLIVFGNLVFVVHENLHAESFLSLVRIFLAVFSLFRSKEKREINIFSNFQFTWFGCDVIVRFICFKNTQTIVDRWAECQPPRTQLIFSSNNSIVSQRINAIDVVDDDAIYSVEISNKNRYKVQCGSFRWLYNFNYND